MCRQFESAPRHHILNRKMALVEIFEGSFSPCCTQTAHNLLFHARRCFPVNIRCFLLQTTAHVRVAAERKTRKNGSREESLIICVPTSLAVSVKRDGARAISTLVGQSRMA